MKKDMEQSETRDVITNNNQKLQITHSQKHKKKKQIQQKKLLYIKILNNNPIKYIQMQINLIYINRILTI